MFDVESTDILSFIFFLDQICFTDDDRDVVGEVKDAAEHVLREIPPVWARKFRGFSYGQGS